MVDWKGTCVSLRLETEKKKKEEEERKNQSSLSNSTLTVILQSHRPGILWFKIKQIAIKFSSAQCISVRSPKWLTKSPKKSMWWKCV